MSCGPANGGRRRLLLISSKMINVHALFSSLPDGKEGTAYNQPLTVTGITGTPTWSITSGALPAGLTLVASTGRIEGTPTTAGDYNFTVRVSAGTNTATTALSIRIVAASAPTPTPAQGCSHPSCHWFTLREADEHNDGEMAYLCSSCGHERYRVPISGYIVFNKNTMQKILDAPQGATISVSTRRWISFHRMVYQALADRPDVTLKVSFLDGEYRGNRYSVTIPAGYDTLSLLNGTDYCGFLYLGSKFGLSPGE